MGAETSVVMAFFFIGLIVVATATYSSFDYNNNLVKKAQYDHDTMKNAKMQTDITITNASFSNSSGNVSLNITLKNTGKTTLNAGLLDIFIDGKYLDSTYCIKSTINTWVPENITNISIYSIAGNISYDSASSSTVRLASSMTWPHNVGSGRSNTLLVVGVDIEKNPPNPYVTSITYGGVDLTRANFSVGSPTVRAELWYLTNPKLGTNNVVVTFSSAIDTEGAIAGAVSFFGVDQTNPISKTVTGKGQGGTASTSITTTNINAWLIDTIVVDNSAGNTATSPQVERWDAIPPSGQISGAGSTKSTTTPGTQSMSWTVSAEWAQVVAEIKPASCVKPTVGRIKVVTENGIWDYAIAS